MAKKGLKHAMGYSPTPKEKSLLEVMINPANSKCTITEVCRLAECSREVYYKAFAKPAFVEYYHSFTKDSIKEHVGQIIGAYIKKAKDGSIAHGNVLLEMAGLYKKTTNVNHTGEVKTVVKEKIDYSNYSLDQLRELDKLLSLGIVQREKEEESRDIDYESEGQG